MTETWTETVLSCARCGSSLEFEACEFCPACGWYDEFAPDCPACSGSGRVPFCASSEAFCTENPLPGCEAVERHTVVESEFPGPRWGKPEVRHG